MYPGNVSRWTIWIALKMLFSTFGSLFLNSAIIYWVITFILERLIKWLETKVTVPDEAPEMDENGNLHIRRGKKEVIIPAASLGITPAASGPGKGDMA